MSFACPPPDDMLLAALGACHRMRRIVVTGNPGSGKSAFTRCLADLGVPTFSSDTAVAEMYAPRGEAAKWIGKLNSPIPLLAPDGSVDKTALMEAMRANPALRREVEGIVHALAHAALESFWANQETLGAPLAVAEVPLFFESGWQHSSKPRPHVVGIRCPLTMRAQRIEANRGWPQEKLEAIEGWQWAQDRKMAACDSVIDNDGTAKDLCDRAHEFLVAMRAKDQKDEQALALHLAHLWQ